MPNAARGNGVDSVSSPDGAGYLCASPMTTATNECSGNVFVNSIGSVRIGDKVAAHPKAGCGPDLSGLSTSSPNVFVNGKGMGRLGDVYGDNTITSGSPNVIVN